MRDHGGDLDAAMARFGGAPGDWLDLSTGINPRPWPLPPPPAESLARLPTRADLSALAGAAAMAYGTRAPVLPLAGASAAIQLVPRLRAPGRAAILGPTYNEHAAAFAAAGWRCETVDAPEALEGADAAVVVNPNNPDGRRLAPDRLMRLAERTGLLVVDESFADTEPGLSLAPHLDGGREDILVERSFGKVYGLAGLRLGFALGGRETVAALADLAGPWAVSGPAIAAGRAALADGDWLAATRARLAADAARLDALAAGAGLTLVGGTALFRTYAAAEARPWRDRLAGQRIWTRIFPYDSRWIRLGLPGDAEGWDRLAAALRAG